MGEHSCSGSNPGEAPGGLVGVRRDDPVSESAEEVVKVIGEGSGSCADALRTRDASRS